MPIMTVITIREDDVQVVISKAPAIAEHQEAKTGRPGMFGISAGGDAHDTPWDVFDDEGRIVARFRDYEHATKFHTQLGCIYA